MEIASASKPRVIFSCKTGTFGVHLNLANLELGQN